MTALRGRDREAEAERRRVDARRREHQMIGVLTVSIAVAFAAVTFLPRADQAAAPSQSAVPTASSRTPDSSSATTSGGLRPGLPDAASPGTASPGTASPGTASPDGAMSPATATAATVTSGAETSGAPASAPGPTASAISPPPVTPIERAASALASSYVAIDAGDLVGAFDHFSADFQRQVGGFDQFAALWASVDTVRTETADCTDQDGVVACRSVIEIVGADGSCTRSDAVTELTLIGTGYRIVAQTQAPAAACAG